MKSAAPSADMEYPVPVPHLPGFPTQKPLPRAQRPLLAMAALICAAGAMSLGVARPARAVDCAGSAVPAAAGTAALYGELAKSIGAEPLSVDITARNISGTCAWVYAVKVLTASGNVALLDFDLTDLGLMRVDGPRNDPAIADLYERLAGADPQGRHQPGSNTPADSNDDSANAGDDNGSEDGSGSGGEGSSGSGSDGGGSEGGSDGGGHDSGGGGEGGGDD